MNGWHDHRSYEATELTAMSIRNRIRPRIGLFTLLRISCPLWGPRGSVFVSTALSVWRPFSPRTNGSSGLLWAHALNVRENFKDGLSFTFYRRDHGIKTAGSLNESMNSRAFACNNKKTTTKHFSGGREGIFAPGWGRGDKVARTTKHSWCFDCSPFVIRESRDCGMRVFYGAKEEPRYWWKQDDGKQDDFTSRMLNVHWLEKLLFVLCFWRF